MEGRCLFRRSFEYLSLHGDTAEFKCAVRGYYRSETHWLHYCSLIFKKLIARAYVVVVSFYTFFIVHLPNVYLRANVPCVHERTSYIRDNME